MMVRFVVAAVLALLCAGSAQAQVRSLFKLQDSRIEFVRACTAHMVGRWAHPEQVCGCLHDHAAARIDDSDLREALLHGISETGVPTIENERVPSSKQSRISETFDRIAKPALQCMFEPLS